MDRIYLDHAATTPLHPRVEEAMAEIRAVPRGNPASPHQRGREARAHLEKAREQVADLLAAEPAEVFFVRGGTESDNLAIQGRVLAQLDRPATDVGARSPTIRLAHSALEHSAVREAAAACEARFGARVEILPVSPGGGVDMEALQRALDPAHGSAPAVVSVQLVNGETGLILEVDEVIRRCREAGVVVHVDAVQGVGRVPVPGIGPRSHRPHLLSLSAHKLGGPGGAGVLLRETGVELAPLLLGGGQEGGIRPGTVDVEAAVGTAEALGLALESQGGEGARLGRLRDRLEARLRDGVPGLRVHGAEGRRAPHILNVGIPGLPRDLLPGALDLEGIAASAGSACRSGATSVSPTLQALYGEEASRVAPLRISTGWSTTEQEMAIAGDRILEVLGRVEELADVVSSVRPRSPLPS